jgi:hypothetical protein
MKRVAVLAVSLAASAAVLPAASSAARARMDSHRAGPDGGGTGADWNGLDGAASPQAGGPLPFQLSDSFSGTSLNSSLWYSGVVPAGTTQGVQDGALQLTASADAASGFNDTIVTDCQAVGDFVAEIHFTLSTWPAGDNVTLALGAPPLGVATVSSSPGGDTYGLFVGSEGVTIPASVSSGELLLSRRGGLASAYARSVPGGRWQLIGRLNAPTSNVWVGPGIYNVYYAFGGQPVSVQVESFKHDAAGRNC